VGYTEAQLEQIIAAKYTDAGFLKNATVSVTVIEARARTFSILGAVNSAGQYTIAKSDFRLLDALVSARGLSVETDKSGARGIEYIYVLRNASSEASEAPATAPAAQPAMPADMLAPKPAAAAPALAPSEVAPAPATAESPATASSGAEGEGRYV